MAIDTRTRILDGALELLRDGSAVTLESAAARAELTKAGLMYHFPTKQALMLGLVDHVVERWEVELSALLPMPFADASAADRIRAYVDFSLTGEFDETDIVMLSDPRLRDPLSERWSERIAPWVIVPHGLPPERRAALNSARLIADGAWFAGATGVLEPDPEEREQIRIVAYRLIGSE